MLNEKELVTKEIKEAVETLFTEAVDHRSGYYVFISYDLVDSTKYKAIDERGWQKLTYNFYQSTKDFFQKRQLGAKIWKYVGDEVLVYIPISNKDELIDCVQEAYVGLRSILHELQGDKQHKKYAAYIKLKGTIWGAICHFDDGNTDLPNNAIDNQWTNVAFYPPPIIEGEGGYIDFLGPQIDAGFRLSKCVAPNNLVVSAELAYLALLNENDETLSNKNSKLSLQFSIVMLKQLKGIWHDRAYPVIWVTEQSDINDNFEYDDLILHEVAREASESKLWKMKIEPHKVKEYLTKVFTNLNYLEELNKTFNSISDYTLGENYDYVTLSSSRNIHVVAVCINEKNEILIAKRDENKILLPKAWEFGCGQLKANETFVQCLKRTYSLDFEIEIKEKSLIPIKSYTINKIVNNKEQIIPGIIFAVKCSKSQNDIKYNTAKHSSAKWVNKDEIKDVVGSDHVPDFFETVELALKATATS